MGAVYGDPGMGISETRDRVGTVQKVKADHLRLLCREELRKTDG